MINLKDYGISKQDDGYYDYVYECSIFYIYYLTTNGLYFCYKNPYLNGVTSFTLTIGETLKKKEIIQTVQRYRRFRKDEKWILKLIEKKGEKYTEKAFWYEVFLRKYLKVKLCYEKDISEALEEIKNLVSFIDYDI